MALNSQPVSDRLRGLQRTLHSARLGRPLDEVAMVRLETMLDACIADTEQLELQTGVASVPDQLRAAGGNIVMLRAVLQQSSGGRHGQ